MKISLRIFWSGNYISFFSVMLSKNSDSLMKNCIISVFPMISKVLSLSSFQGICLGN